MFLYTKLENRADPIKIAFIGCGKFVNDKNIEVVDR